MNPSTLKTPGQPIVARGQRLRAHAAISRPYHEVLRNVNGTSAGTSLLDPVYLPKLDLPDSEAYASTYMQQELQLDTSCVAVVLAGGCESHALAYSGTIAGFPYGPNERVIDVSIAQILRSGVNRIHVMTQFNSSTLNRHLVGKYSSSFFGVRGYLEYNQACQTTDGRSWYRGSADALRRSLSFMKGHVDRSELPQDIIVCSAKQIHDVDFLALVAKHRQTGASVTIAHLRAAPATAASMGLLAIDQTGACLRLDEKPGETFAHRAAQGASPGLAGEVSNPTEELPVSAGIYVFNREALENLLATFPDADHLARDLLPRAIADADVRVQTYAHHGQWRDLGSLRGYHAACVAHVLEDHPVDSVRFMGHAGQAGVAPPTQLLGSFIDSATFGAGCFVDRARVTRSTLGPNTWVCSGAEITDSVIMGSGELQAMVGRDELAAAGLLRQEIGANVVLRGAVVDFDAVVGEGSQLVNAEGVMEADLMDSAGVRISEGLVVVPWRAKVPPGTRV